MRPHKVLKYILDIESMIAEIEAIKLTFNNDFNQFLGDRIAKRAIERLLEIIGEAVKKMIEIDPSIQISSSKKIIGLRNLLAHAYDSVEEEILWGIIQKDILVLKEEIAGLKAKG